MSRRQRFMAVWRAVVPLVVVTMGSGVWSTPGTIAAGGCAPQISLLARGAGSPDDVAVDGSRVLFTDLGNGTLAAVQAGRVSVLASHLSEPEGIVVLSPGVVLVAEQGKNRIDRVNLRTGKVQVVLNLANHTANAGLDALGVAPGGGIYIPDSPNGRLLLLHRKGNLEVLAEGMGRPVGATRWQQGVAVADETAHAVWYIAHGRRASLATLPTPDDVVVFHGRLLAVTLTDHALWEVAPHLRLLISDFVEPQGLAVLDARSVVIADSKRNALDRVSGLTGC